MSDSSQAHSEHRTDTLAASVIVLLGMTLLQRVVGFVRSVLFCRWLEPAQLGEWDMAYSFLFIAAPIAVLGLPGSFGRYVEYYRSRGQLRTLLRRTSITSGIAALVAVATIGCAGPWFSQLIFGRPDRTEIVWALAISLLAVISFNFLTELLTSLRQARVVGLIQFVNGVTFAALGIGLLVFWRSDVTSVVLAFGGAGLIGGIFGITWLRRSWKNITPDAAPLSQRDLWNKLLPYAAWMWIGNLMFNLFEVADRMMLIHCSRFDEETALVAVGNYHSSRVVPLLLLTAAILLGGLITPHLSHDWEAGRKSAVKDRLSLALKLLGLGLFAASLGVLLIGPFLFGVILHGKYEGGYSALPWTLAYCIWFGIATVAQNYLWCLEKARWASAALLAGLIVLIGLNLWWVPTHGLIGAVWATAVAKFVVMSLILLINRQHGMPIDRGLWFIACLPLALGGGPWIAAAVGLGTLYEVFTRDRLLNAKEKTLLKAIWEQYTARFRRAAAPANS